MSKNRTIILIAVFSAMAIGGIAFIFAVAAFLQNPFGRGKLLSTTIDGTTLSLHDTGSFDLALFLHIDRRNSHEISEIIDKSTYGTLRFVRYKDNILVANDQFIFASYNTVTHELLNYNQLPFTVWTNQGKVLDSYTFGSDPAAMRPNFPLLLEQASTRP